MSLADAIVVMLRLTSNALQVIRNLQDINDIGIGASPKQAQEAFVKHVVERVLKFIKFLMTHPEYLIDAGIVIVWVLKLL